MIHDSWVTQTNVTTPDTGNVCVECWLHNYSLPSFAMKFREKQHFMSNEANRKSVGDYKVLILLFNSCFCERRRAFPTSYSKGKTEDILKTVHITQLQWTPHGMITPPSSFHKVTGALVQLSSLKNPTQTGQVIKPLRQNTRSCAMGMNSYELFPHKKSLKECWKTILLCSGLMRQFLTTWLVYNFDYLFRFVLCKEINLRIEHLTAFSYLWRILIGMHCSVPLVTLSEPIHAAIPAHFRLCQKALLATASWLPAWIALAC